MTLVLVAISFALLAIRMLIVRGGKFPVTSISGNKKLRSMGIACSKCEENAKFHRIRKKKAKIVPFELKVVNN